LSEWQFAHADKAEKFALVHQFSLTKVQGDREIEFRISVKEFVMPPDPAMKFYAEADKQTNQHTMPYTPTGWGSTLLKALSECMGAIRRFPYEGE
jgi:hypothetical protein